MHNWEKGVSRNCPTKAAGSKLWEQDGLHMMVPMPPCGQQPLAK